MALALAAGLLALAAAPAAASERRTVKHVAPGLSWTRIVRSAGPERINVLTIDRSKLSGRLASVLSNNRAAGHERVSSMGRRTHALAGVNGGFFAADGNPVGVLDIGGRLVSEPVGKRAALLVPKDRRAAPRVAGLSFAGEATDGSHHRLIDGVDRTPGRIPACGGRGGDRPTQRPNEFITCTDPSELIVFDRSWAARTPRGGYEVVLSHGLAGKVRRSGAKRVPRGAKVLWGSGDGGRFVRSIAPGDAPRVDLTLRSGRSRFEPADFDAIVGGDPQILKRGAVSAFAANSSAPSPRTLAGVTADGMLLLVTVDGRRPGWSAGLSFAGAARLMRSLGARDALNLDSGGSSTMVVGRRLVSRPSDRTGERPVSDALFVVP